MAGAGQANRDIVWAPWRESYILGERDTSCIFCFDTAEDKERYVVWRGDEVFAILNKYPYTNGHILVVPCRHVGDLTALSRTEQSQLVACIDMSVRVLREAFGPAGFNVGMNLGNVAGAGVAEHVHAHVVPRWQGDTSFMTVLSGTRVLCQELSRTRDQLKEVFASLAGS